MKQFITSKFNDQYPQPLSRIRKKEFPTLKSTTYLDHAGTTPYAHSTIKLFSEDLNSHLFGNPHSNSPSSTLSSEYIEEAKVALLRFFKADERQYDLIFVANATAAIKHVMSCLTDYCQAEESELWYGYHRDSHTSLVGCRELTPHVCYFRSDAEVEDWLQGSNEIANFDCEKQVGLFAFPGQSNLTGHRLPLRWSGALRSSSRQMHRRIYTLLDAAALASTAQIDLSNSAAAPDFTAISLYKIFGFPDLGVLIVRKEAGFLLSERRYFGGGTVDMIVNSETSTDNWVARKSQLNERHEDGTLPFHSIIALRSALLVHSRLYGSMVNVSSHTSQLIKYLYQQMMLIRHSNGRRLCTIYTGGAPAYGNSRAQGPIIAFNLCERHGHWIRKTDVEQLAIANGVQLRTGGVCNPGGIADALELSPDEMRDNYTEGLRCGNDIDILNGKPTGVVRVSLGAMTTLQDVQTFMYFLRIFVDGSNDSRSSLAATESSLDEKLGGGPEQCKIDPICDDKAIWICPVATCSTVLSSSQHAREHFRTHGMKSRSKIFRLRSLFRDCSCIAA